MNEIKVALKLVSKLQRQIEAVENRMADVEKDLRYFRLAFAIAGPESIVLPVTQDVVDAGGVVSGPPGDWEITVGAQVPSDPGEKI